MDAMQTILSRRSVRAWGRSPVPDQMIRHLLDAAMHAPSAGNLRPWHFVVIDDPGYLSELPEVCPQAEFAANAPLGILVGADTDLDRGGHFWEQDCAAATQNILLAAHALGLGAVWTGIHPQARRVEAVRRLFGIPYNVVPVSLVLAGFPARKPQPAEERFLPDRVHTNGW